MSINKPIIQAIIIGGANWEQLSQCLDSLISQVSSDSPFQLVITVIDNTGRGDLRAPLHAHYQNILYLKNRSMLGFSANNNQVIAHTGADYLLLVNDDVKMIPGSVIELYDCLLTNLQIGIVGPQLLDINQTKQPCSFKFPTIFSTLIASMFPLRGYGMQGQIWKEHGLSNQAYHITEWTPFTCVLIRKEVFASIGDLDEGYDPGYAEDVDWCRRMHSLRWLTAVNTNSLVIHYGGQTFGTNSGFRFRQAMKNLLRYHYKWDGFLVATCVRVLWTLGFGLRMCFALLLNRYSILERLSGYRAAIRVGIGLDR